MRSSVEIMLRFQISLFNLKTTTFKSKQLSNLKISLSIEYHCDLEVSCNFIALAVLSFDMKFRQGEELETGVPWF